MSPETDTYSYHMARGNAEMQRLHEQFQLLTKALGWIIHPSISQRLPKKPAIADVATGTGAYLVALSETYPEGRFVGCDISSTMFPGTEDLPSNMRLVVADAKQPFSEDHGTFDLVHVRYITAAMEKEDWDVMVDNLLPLLKSGGALQWEEPNFQHATCVRGMPNSTTAALSRLLRTFCGGIFQDRIPFGWSTLPTIMEQAGLVVETDIVSCDRDVETRRSLTENNVKAMLGGLRVQIEKSMSGAMAQKGLQQLEEACKKDIESGGYLRFDIHTAIGFKRA